MIDADFLHFTSKIVEHSRYLLSIQSPSECDTIVGSIVTAFQKRRVERHRRTIDQWLAVASLVGSISLTIIIWVIGYLFIGGPR